MWLGTGRLPNIGIGNITLRSPEAARYVQDMESIRINDATGTIRGQQHILDVKLHWVPAWMDTYYLKHIMQQYGEVMKVEREQLVLHDDISFDSGTVMMRIKTTAPTGTQNPLRPEVPRAGPGISLGVGERSPPALPLMLAVRACKTILRAEEGSES